MKSTSTIDIQEATFLPIYVVNIADRAIPSILVQTPHKGRVEVRLKNTSSGFLGLGPTTQTERYMGEIMKQIRELEMDATEYLVNEWKKTL